MDERSKYFRRLNRLRNSARRWSVLSGGLIAATTVLVPYHDVGAGDAIWAGAAGASAALTWWRWNDLRAVAATPAPPPPEPTLPSRRLTAAIERFPAGRTVLQEVRRHKDRYALRGSAITQAWDRLDRAAATLVALAGRLIGSGEQALLEAAVAEQWLRDLGQRVAAVERAIPLAPPDQLGELERSHAGLADQFTEGVTAYERLVAAAASCVAEGGQPLTDGQHSAFAGLVDATDRLRGIADGLAELRRPAAPTR